ncbi:hypothetical protein B0H19DRAFT_1260770 [Mycena capillaripes]|nr:hypothetical protein B0H19DRAFT_1260770 [Mycena capillaripes]
MTSNLSGSRFSGAAYDVYPKLLLLRDYDSFRHCFFFARSVPCHARLDAGGSALDTQVPPPTIFFLLRALARYYWTPAVLPTSAELFARPAPSHTRLSVGGSARDTQVPPPNDFFFRALLCAIPGRGRCSPPSGGVRGIGKSRPSTIFFSCTLVRYSRTRVVLPASAESFARPAPSHTHFSVGGSVRDTRKSRPPSNLRVIPGRRLLSALRFPRPLPHSGSHSSLTLVSFILLPTLSIDFTSLVPLLLSTPPWRALSQLAFDRLNRGSGVSIAPQSLYTTPTRVYEPLPELLRRPTSATTPPTLEAAILAPPLPSDKPVAETMPGQVQEWWAYWTVPAAAKFEALIHLHFKLMGAWILPSECEFCGVNHCELFDFLACGGREGIARVVEFYHRRLNWPVSK